jgi:hypothetical protein
MVGPDRGLEQTAELLLLHYQEMIQASSPQASHKAFVIWHWLVASGNGVRSTLIPRVAATCATCCPYVQSVSRISYAGVCPYGIASRNGGATQGSV